jgi:hypothetical protein
VVFSKRFGVMALRLADGSIEEGVRIQEGVRFTPS